MSCLVIKNDGMGDLVLMSGVIAELTKVFDGNLDLVTCETNKDIAENLYGVRHQFYISRDDLRFHPRLMRWGILKPIAKNNDREILKNLATVTYDYAICLRRFIRASSLILMHSTRARNKLCAWQFPTNVSHEIAEKASKGWDRYSGNLDIISELKYFEVFIRDVLQVTIDPRPRLKCTDGLNHDRQPKTVGICLGGNSTNWPAGYWIELVKKLLQSKWHIFLFGGENVSHLASWIEHYCKEVQNFVGSLNFLESISYLKNLSAFIGNDTGFTHFASLIIPKVLIILGGGTFKRFFPWYYTQNQHVIYHAIDCFDCDWKCKFKDRYCMHLISSSDVFRYFEEMVNSDNPERMRNLNPSAEKYRVGWRYVKGEHVYSNF